jgi:hypothetical protein
MKWPRGILTYQQQNGPRGKDIVHPKALPSSKAKRRRQITTQTSHQIQTAMRPSG